MASIVVVSVALASSIVVGSTGPVEAAPAPETPDCAPDPVAPPTADPVGTGTNSLSGVIGVAGGDTLPDVTVWARSTDWIYQYQVQTDANGAYSFNGLEDGSWNVYLDPQRFPNRYYCNQRDEMMADPIGLGAGTHLGDVNLLVGPGSISGTVSADGPGGVVPVTDANVWAYSTMGEVLGGDVTDENGAYLIEGLEEGDHRIQVAKPGMPDYWYGGGTYFAEAAPVLLEPGNLSAVADVPVSPSGVSGTITLNGAWVSDRTISIRSTTEPKEANGVSGLDGEFSFQHLPAGDYRVYVDLDGASVPVNELITVDGWDSQTDIPLTVPTGSIEGDVYRDGVLVDGSMEYLQVFAESVTDQQQYWADVDEFGHYRIDYVADDTFVVGFIEGGSYPAVWHPGTRDRQQATQVSPSGGALTGIDIDVVGLAAITGRVVDQNGLGIEAAVTAYTTDWEWAASTSTNPDGSYRLEVEDGTYRVYAGPSGNVGEWWYDGADDFWNATDVTVAGADVPDIDVVKTRAGFFGVISDGTDGVPWLNVRAQSVDDPDRSAYGSTDENGQFRFEFLPAGTYTIRVSDPMFGYDTPVGTAVSDGSTVVDVGPFVLPSGSVSGAITVGGQTPDEAEVNINIELHDSTGNAVRSAQPGDGVFSFTNLADGTYTMYVGTDVDATPIRWYPGTVDESAAAPIVVSGGAAVGGIDMDLPAPGLLTGEVRGPGGALLPDTQVTLYRGPNPSGGYYVTSTTTDIEGRYDFQVGIASYAVAVQYDELEFGSPGTTNRSNWQLATVAPGGTETLDIQVPAPGYIEGTVTVPFGDDSGIQVLANSDGFVEPGRLVGVTGAGGTYVAGPLYDETVTLRFVPDGASGLAPNWYPGVPGVGAATRIAVVPGATLSGYDVTLGEPVSISGQVDGIDGNPTRAVVRAWAAGSDFGSPTGVPYVAQFEAPDGAYAFDGLPPGEYVISASPWYDELVQFAMTYSGDVVLWDDATTVNVPSGGSATVDIRAQIGSRITGRVTDPDGNGVAGAVVNASDDPYGSGDVRIEWRQTYTDPDGYYALTGLVPGSDVRLYAGVQGNVPWLLGEYYPDVRIDPLAPTVAVPANGDDLPTDIALERGMTGTVTVEDDNGPVPPSTDWSAPRPVVCLAPDVPPSGVGCNVIGVGVSSGTDVHHLTGLAPGTYNIAATEWFSSVGDVASFTIAAGQTVECTLGAIGSSVDSECVVGAASAGATITGTVIDPFGNPQPGVVVNVYESEFGYLGTGGYTLADGSYTIQDVPPGTYQLRFEDPYRIGRTEPSLIEWWSTTGDVYEFDYELAADIVVTGTETLTGYDLQLDLPVSGTVTVGDDPAMAELNVVLCEGTASYDGGFNCVDENGGYVSAQFGERDGNTVSYQYLRPGQYTAVGVQGSFWTGGVSVISDEVTFSAPASHTFECDLPLLGSGESAGCTVTPVVIVEDDDGVDSDEEQGAPNDGDGNDDGVPDDQQDSVASLEDPTIDDPDDDGSNYVTIAASAVDVVDDQVTTPTPITDVAIVQPTSEPPAGVTTQSSVLEFTVPNLAVGQTVSLRVFLPQPADSYWKYDPDTETWVDATSLADFDVDPTLIGDVLRWGVTLTITDGGFGDDDGLADGKVEDPGVFTTTERERPVVTVEGLLPGARVPVGSPTGATCVATDNVGVAVEATLTIEAIGVPHADGVGAYRATCDGARDFAGNEGLAASVDFSYVYGRAEGVFTGGPVLAPPTVNEGKAGRTFPMRWELYRADGSAVNQLGAVTDWAAYTVACSALDSELVNPVESASTEASTLRVTPAGEFQLNLKTAKSDRCLIVAVYLVDGSALTARFSLR